MQGGQSEGSGSVSSGQTGGAGSGVCGGSRSDSQKQTTTKIITINRITYLQTTTVSNGVTTVEKTEIGSSN